MILRRVIAHFRKQEWTAIAIDFVIVVLGVFVGMQVNNWNEAAQSRAEEAAVLEQLRGGFADTVARLREAKGRSEERLEAGREVLRAIRDAREPEDRAAFAETLRLASSFDSGPDEPTILTEILSSGALSNLDSPSLRTALIKYHERFLTLARNRDIVLQRISSPRDGHHTAIHYDPDIFGSGENPITYDWEKLPAAREQYQVLLIGKNNLHAGIKDLIELGDAVLDEIEKAQQ